MVQQTEKKKVLTFSAGKGKESTHAVQLKDNRPQAVVQQKQLSGMNPVNTCVQPVQRKTNNTGLPDNLKSGVEQLSGITMDDVRVHYNSPQPAQLQAHAYAQGTNIHIAPGQEKHLPHEAWHVVQQKQGRVKPTMQLKTGLPVNDNRHLEREADVMGQNALTQNLAAQRMAIHPVLNTGQPVAQFFGLSEIWAMLPGLLVMSEGALSLASAGIMVTTGSPNPYLLGAAITVGGLKVIRGVVTMINAVAVNNKTWKKRLKFAADTLRIMEAAASAVSVTGGTITTAKEKRKLGTIITGALFALVKLLRSIGHFFEGQLNSRFYSVFLQVVETAEGLIIFVGSFFNDNTKLLGLGAGMGVSKMIRGGVAAKQNYDRNYTQPGEEQHLVVNNEPLLGNNKV